MKVLHVGARDISGGAGRAMYRLHQGLRTIGVDSHILVNQKSSTDTTVHGPSGMVGRAYNVARREIDSLPVRRYQDRESGLFSPNWLPELLTTRIRHIDPDIVNLHWVGGGVLQPKTLSRLEYPFVWTMHDMWPFTGGCHYSAGCGRYRESCGSCPKLSSGQEHDLSRQTWRRKATTWKDQPIHPVAPSLWLAECARRSSLFEPTRVRVIPNGIDLRTYSPQAEDSIRARFDFPEDCIVLLFGAVAATDNKRKGFDLLTTVLQRLKADIGGREVRLVIFGTEEERIVRRHGIVTHELSYVPEESLIRLYATGDAMLVPSREDNLPNTVMEALACGTPCVAFNLGGLSDMILSRENGYLAEPFDIDEFAFGVAWVTASKHRNKRLGRAARRCAERKYSVTDIATQYQELYESITSKRAR